jgi:hypothetical protein
MTLEAAGVWMDTLQAVQYAGTNSQGRPNISPRVLNRACRKKQIHFGRNGRKYLFKPEHIDAYFLANGFDGRRRPA